MPRLMLYRHKPLPPTRHLLGRMLRSVTIATTAIGGALGMGMLGYHHFGEFDWVDSFYQASMILSGEGPPAEPNIANLTPLHLFAGFYALFSGVTFITLVGVLLGPAIQRFLHRFHLEITSGQEVNSSPLPESAGTASVEGTGATAGGVATAGQKTHGL
jgi:hypothetical protein